MYDFELFKRLLDLYLALSKLFTMHMFGLVRFSPLHTFAFARYTHYTHNSSKSYDELSTKD